MRIVKWSVSIALVLSAEAWSDAATLSITAGANNPPAATVNPGTTGHAMLELNLAASGGYLIRVTRLVVRAQGTLDDVNELTGVRLYADNGNGSFDGSDTLLASSSFSADDGAATFTFTMDIPNATSQNWWVVYDLSSSATGGDTFRVGFTANTDITAQYKPS